MVVKFKVLPHEDDRREYHLPARKIQTPYWLQISGPVSNELKSLLWNQFPAVKIENDIWINLPAAGIPEHLSTIPEVSALSQRLSTHYWEYRYGGRILQIGKKPLIQGIVNVTPDSFSDGGRFLDADRAVEQALQLAHDGAGIIDIGGESTRPGAGKVSVEEEWDRVKPVLSKLAPQLPDNVWISIDTTKAEVARRALDAGAHIINDISGLTFDPLMENVAAEFQCPVIIMHIKGTPDSMQKNPSYKHVMDEIEYFFEQRIAKLREKGIDQLILDPGIGFGKRLADNYEILRRLKEFKQLGYPLLLGLSRKSFMWKILQQEPHTLDPHSAFLSMIGVLEGADILRVHNAALTRSFLILLNKVLSEKT